MPAKQKKIIYKSKSVYTVMAIIGWGFTIMCALEHFIFGTLFFGFVALYTLYPFLNWRMKVVWIGSKEFDEINASQFEERYKDEGIFTYNDEGFSVQFEKEIKNVKWDEIESLIAFKRDNYTTDTICMDIFCENDFKFSINEEVSGWYVFVSKLQEKFPQIDKKWQMEIAHPAFKTNQTLLYKKGL